MPFKPGQSGNPGGRAKADPELVSLARTYTREAIERTAQILRSTKSRDSDKLKAVEILLDRGHGKPTQPVEHSGDLLDGLSLNQRSALEDALGIIAGPIIASASGESATTH